MTAGETAPVPCRICSGTASHWKDVHDVNQRLAREPFPTYRCRDCGGLFLHPVPQDLGRYYPAAYHDVPADLAAFRSRIGRQSFKIDIVRRHASGGDLLEIGPSHCEALYLAREAGFRVHGLEMDERCCRFAKDVLGLDDVRASADPVADLPKTPSFDVVMLWHAFEHLPDPWGAAAAIAAAMRPGGVLVIAVPNPGSLQLAVFGRWWVHLDAPRHTMLVTASALARRLAPLGFALAEVTYTDRGSLGWNWFGWSRGFTAHARGRVSWFALSVLARACQIVAVPFERTGRRGTAYTAVFRKSAA